MLNSSCFSEGRPESVCARAEEGQVRECGNVDEHQYEHEDKGQRAPTLRACGGTGRSYRESHGARGPLDPLGGIGPRGRAAICMGARRPRKDAPIRGRAFGVCVTDRRWPRPLPAGGARGSPEPPPGGWAGGWVLHPPPWSFGFDSQTRGTRENRRTLY
jgi:hypothetical protein